MRDMEALGRKCTAHNRCDDGPAIFAMTDALSAQAPAGFLRASEGGHSLILAEKWKPSRAPWEVKP